MRSPPCRDAFRKPRSNRSNPDLSAEPAAAFDVDRSRFASRRSAPTILDAMLTGLTDARGSYSFTGQGQTW